ncbi:ClpXP protease specificity-enhancing factor [Marinicella gelatinilytica]|uniref:ClpXP protease specificity-enhancing factor n=1 Tax=Marinicella gelatinilytica TaxID=2996017 RepID=UPI002260D4F1|nr:ClpXP protease specificity-enhancing factor [Marinicella gelatinilytica]MCX7545311.1 ClpXP protease specificity-enhancing factor [Marinicella gelatinilytica]
MTSVKPYLIEALYQWISDNQLTPLVVADVSVAGVKVPETAIEDGKVVLNVSMTATQGLSLEDEIISFSARFSGRPFMVVIPMAAVTAIYARENSKGMMFDVDPDAEIESDDSGDQQSDKQEDKTKATKKTGHLKLVD